MLKLGKETASVHIGKFHTADTVFALVFATGALGVEVVVPRSTGKDLAFLGDPESFCE